MKLDRILTGLLLCALLFGLAAVVRADDPPKPTTDLPEPTSTSTRVGDFDPMPIQSGELVLDPSTASITRLELAEDEKTLVPAPPPSPKAPASKGSSAPGPIVLGKSGSNGFQIIPDSANLSNDLLIGIPAQSDPASQKIGAAASTSIMFENFEGVFPPGDPLWAVEDDNGTANGEYLWDDVPCFPIESTGSRSAWPADAGANGLNLGPSDCNTVVYPANVDSWLIYGPFSLADAGSASLDFYFRLVSQSCDPITNCDFLFWGASTNNINYFGDFAAGAYTSGPFNNGYNFASLDLSFFAGQPQVWVAIVFNSNGDGIANQGPFIDVISLRKNSDARTNLTDENFDVINFPNQFWESFDNDGSANGDYRWDDVQCFARSDGWSMWPADEGGGPPALNVCAGDRYPDNARSWLLHGPFSLTSASEAWVDFYFRNESETGWDYFIWMVSKEGSNFSGFGLSGDYTSGPFGNGYNLMRFDLSDVPTLGDLRGEPEVWLAFVFQSDTSFTYQGPFIDDVSVVVERSISNQAFLPIIFKAPPVPTTNLFIKNETTGNVSYTVRNTPQGNITCNNIAAGTTSFCGSFDSGTYEVSVSSAQCGTNSGEVNFAPGDVTRVVRCVSS
jgi:hypothetical protein